VVVFETSMGSFAAELYPERAPRTVENFLAYVDGGHYDGTIVYRVTGFLIQAGSIEADLGRRPTRPPIRNEAGNGLRNERGWLGMARYQPHTATAEFYVNISDNSWLDFKEESDEGWGYCVFGRVVGGMEVVDRIAKVPTGARGNLQETPLENVVIHRVFRPAAGPAQPAAMPD
jgi:peptidyl-prolyl cis-trans isomerase B (cyclophilin B)